MTVTMLTVILFSSLVSLGAVTSQAPAPAQAAPGPAIVVPAFSAPTREFVPPLGAELAALRTGAQLYDKGEYDKAIEVFQGVLADNPTSTGALYELALVHLARKDYQKAVDMAARLTEIRTPDLAKVYALIGNTLDMAGDPKRAVEVYRKGIEFAREGVVTLHYNLAITYAQSLKDLAASKAAAKEAAIIDPTHASTQLYLSKLFLREDLRTPGLLAVGRFLILEPASPRIQEAYTLWYQVMQGNMAPDGKGGMTVKVNPAQSKDEGDLTQLDLHITLSRINAMAAADKTDIQKMVVQVDSLLGVYGTTPAAKDGATFLGSYYMPFFLELRAKGFVEPFVYYISQRTPFPGVREWLTANQPKVDAFLSWSRTYQWPSKR
jgi:hypothetical protein